MMFTTSWDDGCKTDIRLANLLTEHDCTGTFYVCPKPQQQQYGKGMLTEEDIRSIAKHHEVGAHTLKHVHLTQISQEHAREEITRSKQWVEDVSGKPCTMFCYPYGEYDEQVRTFVKQAGFYGARTTQVMQFTHNDPFALPTSLHLYPFPFRPVLNRRCLGPIQRLFAPLHAIGIPLTSLRSWLPMAKALFKKAYESHQPWFHLWGHSWEIARHGLWKPLTQFLRFVHTHDNVQYVPHSSLV